MIVSEDIKRAYAIYSLLDTEQQKAACEIAKRYPYSTEHVAKVLLTTGFDQKEAEKYIVRELTLAGCGF